MKNIVVACALGLLFVPMLVKADVVFTVEFLRNGVYFAKPVMHVVAGQEAILHIGNSDENEIIINASLVDNQVHADISVRHMVDSELVNCLTTVDVAIGSSVTVVCPNSGASIIVSVEAGQ